MPIYTWTGYSTGYTLSEIRERILYNLGQVAANAVSYSRYPQTVVNDAINEAQRDIAIKCPTIQKVCIVNTTADQGWYLCPANMIPNGILRAYYYNTTSSYDKLKVWDRQKLDKEYDGWKVADSGTPEIIVPGQAMYGNRFTFEAYPSPDTSGSWDTQPTGVYLGGAPSTTTTSVTGTATGGNTTTLTDTSVDFTVLGLVAGMPVWNVTDNGYGYISSIATQTITLVSAMTNSATFDSGDSYEIVTDFAGVVSDWDDDDEQYIFSAELGTVSDFQPQADNILLEYYSYPINLSIDADYPQLPLTFQDALMDLATARLASMGHEKTRQMALAEAYSGKGWARLDPYIQATKSQPFENMHHRLTVRMRGRPSWK